MTENAAAEAAFEYNRRRCQRKKAKGSSIVEMLVAIFVLGMVLISMLGMFLISRTAIYNKDDETANTIALRYLEELEGLPFASFTPAFAQARNFGKFTANASVVPGSGTDYMVRVRVVVTWEAAVMGARSMALERTISAGGHRNVGDHL
jgi:Tfp pilus assembly protein PilV